MSYQQERRTRNFSTDSIEPQSHTPLLQRLDSLTSVDVDTYTSLLKVCGSCLRDCRKLHDHIIKHGYRSNRFLGFLILEMYGKCGLLRNARDLFDQLHVRNVVTWTTLIGGHVECGYGNEALNCYERMLNEGLSPDAVTFISKVCGIVRAIEKGKQIHDKIVGLGWLEQNIVLGNALMDMYVKFGLL